jgi:hypothetical protein
MTAGVWAVAILPYPKTEPVKNKKEKARGIICFIGYKGYSIPPQRELADLVFFGNTIFPRTKSRIICVSFGIPG